MLNDSPIFAFQDSYGPWHEQVVSTLDVNNKYANACIYCGTACDERIITIGACGYSDAQIDKVSLCPRCGWWAFSLNRDDGFHVDYFTSSAILKEFKTSDIDLPLDALIGYVSKNNDRLQDVHPAKFEEVVGRVIGESLGCAVEYCSYGRPDKGIDLILINTSSGEKICIQAKRYRNPIELGIVHQFAGAMLDAGFKKGLLVTSGKFRSGALKAADRLFSHSGIEIDLVDSKRILELVGILNTKRRSPDDISEEVFEKFKYCYRTNWGGDCRHHWTLKSGGSESF